ncbi:MAG TPA: antibiotic biosynthesis monooxygenase [Candidatus Hydrogenedens sp.]|nr:antibiotic biosynthesis monooxygenase [Candidatus Hydrogenedens sp.]
MFVVFVYVHVKPEFVEAFRIESEHNARESRKEAGVVRFDILQQMDDPTRFVLYEAYKDEDGAKAHKETAHYAKWRDAVAPMMAEPRYSVKYNFCLEI